MEYLRLNINSNEDIWELIDKSVQHNYIHQFQPNELLEWWETEIKLKNGAVLKDVLIRELQFDLLTDQQGLKKILELRTQQFDLYQFSQAVPASLRISDLPEKSKHAILRENGLLHIFICRFEMLEIRSVDSEFISNIRQHPKHHTRIVS